MSTDLAAADLRYPIGKLIREKTLTDAARADHLRAIEELPVEIRRAVAGLDEEQLDTPYRDGGWTVRQVVHHLADSHMNAFTRMRLAVTEDNPTIKPYDETAWAELADSRTAPVALSLSILDGLHQRWTTFLRALEPAAFGRPLVHPEIGGITMDDLVQIYGWHSRHHVAHVTTLRRRRGW